MFPESLEFSWSGERENLNAGGAEEMDHIHPINTTRD